MPGAITTSGPAAPYNVNSANNTAAVLALAPTATGRVILQSLFAQVGPGGGATGAIAVTVGGTSSGNAIVLSYTIAPGAAGTSPYLDVEFPPGVAFDTNTTVTITVGAGGAGIFTHLNVAATVT